MQNPNYRPCGEPVGLVRQGIWVPFQIVPEVFVYYPKALLFPISLGFLIHKVKNIDISEDDQ